MYENFTEDYDHNFHILHWSYRDLNRFPEELLNYGKDLEDIYLKGNNISSVPKWIITLENLKEIHLSENKLRELPEEISCLKSLQILDVSKNQIAELPSSVINLRQLQYLNVTKNRLKKLPEEIGKMKNLIILYAGHNSLSRIPDSIFMAVSLQEIDVEHNQLTSLPASIVYMENLEFLSVCFNNILYLPALPFHTPLILLAEGNENLTHVSDGGEYLRQRQIRPRLASNELTKSYKPRELIGKNASYPHYSIVTTETENTLIIPLDRVFDENSRFVPSLRELCLYEAYSSCYYQITNNYRHQIPASILVELNRGPTARCRKCGKDLFSYSFLRVFQNETYPNEPNNIVQYFCSDHCIKMHKKESNTNLGLEIRWKCRTATK